MESVENKYRYKILTIPNVLSFFRLCLIPVFVWTYCEKKDYMLTALAVFVSGLTDVVDGFIARRFHMVSEFGKAFDPIADKLTQLALLICLLTRFPQIWVLTVLLVIKEFFSGVSNLVVIRKLGRVYGAEWHGKLTTCAIYGVVMLHLFWYSIPANISWLFVGICAAIMVMSFCMYSIRNVRLIKNGAETQPE